MNKNVSQHHWKKSDRKINHYLIEEIRKAVLLWSFLVFFPGEPNDEDGEDCLELRSEFSWKWNDESCDYKRPFICELHGSVTLFLIIIITIFYIALL